MKNNNFEEITSEFINDVLEKEPPYKNITFDYREYSSISKSNTIKINNYCSNCNRDSVFCGDSETQISPISRNIILNTPSLGAKPKSFEELFAKFRLPILFKVNCAKCGEEHYYSLLFEKNTVKKIGQYPSFASEKTNEIRKYKNIIPEYYIELTKSLSAYSQGMGVASFTYLRRILEWIIDKRFKGEENTKFIDKLHSVEKEEIVIPEDLETIKNEIYRILSKGIHEYSEEECLTLYEAVLFVITRILDVELKKKENKKKTDSIIKQIKGKLSEDKDNG